MDRKDMTHQEKNVQRLRTWRKYPLTKDCRCTACNTHRNLERHHYGPGVDDFIWLCSTCHTDLHMDQGTWGRQGKTRLTVGEIISIFDSPAHEVEALTDRIGITRRYASYIRSGARLKSITNILNETRRLNAA